MEFITPYSSARISMSFSLETRFDKEPKRGSDGDGQENFQPIPQGAKVQGLSGRRWRRWKGLRLLVSVRLQQTAANITRLPLQCTDELVPSALIGDQNGG
jgi:hypothetical protein